MILFPSSVQKTEKRKMFGLLANTINVDMGMIPGLAIIGPGLGFPLSALAAFLERPFYSRAGVQNRVIWYSLQANFVSHLLGVGITFGFFCPPEALRQVEFMLLIWPLLAVVCSILIEGNYLRYKISPLNLNWGWVIGGNICSASLSVALIFGIIFVRERYPSEVRVLIPAQMPLHLAVTVASFLLFLLSFWMTPKKSAPTSAGVGTSADASIPE